jgi:hypothetical protein
MFASLVVVPCLKGDTLTRSSHEEINGKVSYTSDDFSITARYSNGARTTTFNRKEVLSIEFNDRDFNSGSPPKDISVFDGRSLTTKDASREVTAASDENKRKKSQTLQDHKSVHHSVMASNDYNPSDDVISLRDNTRIVGRLVKIEDGQVTLQTKSEDKKVSSKQVTSVLVSHN